MALNELVITNLKEMHISANHRRSDIANLGLAVETLRWVLPSNLPSFGNRISFWLKDAADVVPADLPKYFQTASVDVNYEALQFMSKILESSQLIETVGYIFILIGLKKIVDEAIIGE